MGFDSSEYFSKKNVFLNVILTGLIVLLHATPLLRFGLEIDKRHFFIYSIWVLCQIAVPLFFFISAVLFYNTCTSFADVLKKIKRRVVSLLIPYLLWNSLFVAIYYVLTHVPVLHNQMNMGQALDSIDRVFVGIIDSRFTPLWFVKILMYYVAFSPVILYFLRNRILFLCLFLIASICSFYYPPMVYDCIGMWLPMYLMGAYVGYNKIQMEKKNGNVILLFITMLCTYVVAFVNTDCLQILRFWWPLAVWFITDWLLANFIMNKFRVKKWMGYSFFIYCTHYFVLNVLQKAVVKFFPVNDIVLNLTFVITPVITIVFLIFVAEKCSKFRLYKILTGGR